MKAKSENKYINIKFITKYLKMEKLSVFFCILLSIFIVTSITLIPYFIGEAIDLFALKDYEFNLLIKYVSLIGICLIILVISQLIFDILLGTFIERITVKIREEVFIKLLRVPLKYIDENPKGNLVSKIINDVDNINTGLMSSFRQFVTGFFQIIAILSIMLYLNWVLALIVLILTPFSFILSYNVAKRTKQSYKKSNKLLGDCSSNFLETLNNIETVKSFNYEKESYEKFVKINEELYKAGQKAQFVSSLTNPSSRLINNTIYAIVGTCAALFYCFSASTNFEFLGTTMTIGIIATFLQYAIQFAKPFDSITACLSEIQNAFSSIKRIKDVLDYSDDVDLGNKEVDQNINEISFNNVSFGYDSSRLIIDELNITIPKGIKVAIVGPTGCGKTTLINLLLRYYDVSSGSINFNETNINDIKKKDIRNKFGLVLQDTWIFNGTVKENIAYGKKDATMEEIKEAAIKANALDFIERLGKGFDTLIKDDSGLSAGQRQLISIARVMLMNPEIMILDEATSNIDTRSEKKISDAFDKLVKGKTAFMIAHRLSTIINSDLILVLKDGKIIEKGNHQELLSLKGFYYSLYNAQFND